MGYSDYWVLVEILELISLLGLLRSFVYIREGQQQESHFALILLKTHVLGLLGLFGLVVHQRLNERSNKHRKTAA